MAAWHEVEAVEPEFAARVREVFEAHPHKTMATLRADGSPRISGTEATFREGAIWLGMMPASRKGQDLLRDPRVAIHSAPVDTKMTQGDAKVSGRVVLETDDEWLRGAFEGVPDGAIFFRIDIGEVVLTRVVDSQTLTIEFWREGAGLRTQTGA